MDEGDATAADPVCHLSPMHDQVAAVAAAQQDAPYIYRRIAAKAFQEKWNPVSVRKCDNAGMSRIGEIP
jgi:hypothetical protein